MAKLPGPIELEISELAGIWREHGNPAAAWRCFVLAREHGFPVPEVIDAEIMRFAQAVTAPLADKKDTITQKSVAAAWGIAAGRKPAPELRNTRRDTEMYFEYWDLRRTVGRKTPTGEVIIVEGLSRTDAILALAAKHNMPPKTVEAFLTTLSRNTGRATRSKTPHFATPDNARDIIGYLC